MARRSGRFVGYDAAGLEQQIRARVDSLSYLPTTVGVAMRLIHLGKNLEAGPKEYARIIGTDPALSARILSLANSPWFGVRNRVTHVNLAVSLMGLGTVRTVALSYCMAGLHNELRLSHDEARTFWEVGLCKAVAARHYVERLDRELGEDAFAAGIFQDFALPLMYVAAREPFRAILRDASSTWAEQLTRERDLMRVDHPTVGRMLAQKLDLPEVYMDAVAFHHDHPRLREVMHPDALADAVYVSSLFPHTLDAWNHDDAEELCRFLNERAQPPLADARAFLEEVQKEFHGIARYFADKGSPEARITDLLIEAAAESADHTTHLVRTVYELRQESADLGLEWNQLIRDHTQLEDKASRDPLTGILNRDGITTRGEDLLVRASRYGLGVSVLYVDLDHFKSINDTQGHEVGDLALRKVASRMAEAVRRQDLAGRMGGDEFVMLLYDCPPARAAAVAERILAQLAAEPVTSGEHQVNIRLSAGLLHVPPSPPREHDLAGLIAAADKLMYQAKQAGGNRVQVQELS